MKPSEKPKTSKHLLPRKTLEDLGLAKPRHKQNFSLLCEDDDPDEDDDTDENTEE